MKIVLKEKLSGKMNEDKKFIVNEIEALKVLPHPNIVTLYEVITDDKRIHLVMDYLSGPSLDNLVDQPT